MAIEAPLPTSPSLSAERCRQIQHVISQFLSTFTKAEADRHADNAVDSISGIYHPEVCWFDHAFLIQRRGLEAVAGLRKSFTDCNVPFGATVKELHATSTGAVLEQVWIGKQTNDIVRKSGEVAVKASGKEFKCHVCMVIAIDEQGLITRIDEYYNKLWDNGIEEEKYFVVM